MSETQEGPGWWRASDGKWYPPSESAAAPPPPPPAAQPYGGQPYGQPPVIVKKKGHGCLYAVLGAVGVVVLLVIIVVAAASNSSDKSTSTTAPSGPIHNVGDTARSSDFDVTVYGFTDPVVESGISTASPGQHLVSVDLQVTNRASAQQSFSSLLGLHLVDAQNRQFNETIADVTPGPPDGEVAPDGSIRGNVVFAVPDGTPGPLMLKAQGSPTAAGALFRLG